MTPQGQGQKVRLNVCVNAILLPDPEKPGPLPSPGVNNGEFLVVISEITRYWKNLGWAFCGIDLDRSLQITRSYPLCLSTAVFTLQFHHWEFQKQIFAPPEKN